ncbi:MAG: TonB-dependent receptor plug domain-containing protein, partial [Bryobacteraceae bacterium]
MRTRIAVLLFVPLMAKAAGPCRIHGRVLDPSGAVVSGAVVTITSRDGQVRRVVETGADGAWLAELACAPESLAQAKAPGFDPSPARAVADSSGEVDLALSMARVDTALAVTSSGAAETEQRVAKSLDVLSRDAIDARGEFSLAEAVRLTPGVRVLQLGGPGSFVQILTRGMRAYDTAVLIDGFRFRDAAAVQGDATAYLGDLMIVDTGRVEVLRGSG